MGYFGPYSRGIARVQECTAAAARPRAARAMLSCAGAYVSGAAGSNECPAGSTRIVTEAACRTAAASAGMTFGSTSVEANYPRCCYYYISPTDILAIDITAYFNTHAVGAGEASSRPLCAAVATTGAPLRAPCGSAGPTGERRVWCGTMHRQTYGALTRYCTEARGQRVSRSCASARFSGCVPQRRAVHRTTESAGLRVLSPRGTHGVLPGVCCSRVLTGYS
jgi:hypothetical protein